MIETKEVIGQSNPQQTQVINQKALSCDCHQCQGACEYKPGWFLPEQMESLFAFFKISSLDNLLEGGKLAIDWWNDDNGDILVLAPNIIGNDEIQYPNNPKGECVFYKNGKCQIYDIRPFECAMYLHDQDERKINKRHEMVAMQWKQLNILDKYEDEVETGGYSIFDEMGMSGFFGL